jgi:stress response protein SCP2
MNLARGQRATIAELGITNSQFQLGLSIDSKGLSIDYSCFGLDRTGMLSDERYMTFFNQPRTPCGGVELGSASGKEVMISFDLQRLPATITRLVVVAAIDGAGQMSQIARGTVRVLPKSEETARFDFIGSDFQSERALMLLECYRKDSEWRVLAVGQGFNGGLDALVKHFGGAVQPPSGQSEASASPPKNSLEKKMERDAPHLVSLAKKAAISLEKKKLDKIVARVGLVLDASGSMSNQYASGRVQEVVDRILPLAVHFDDDGSLDCWAFAEKAKELTPVTLKNEQNYVKTEWGGWQKWMKSLNASINYEPEVMREVMKKYGISSWDKIRSSLGGQSPSDLPAYVIFLSDGGVGSDAEIADLLIQSSKMPIFWQFVGIGGSNYGILERFDKMSGRYVDNCNFFALDDLHSISDQELYDRLLNEFPQWLSEAKSKKLIQ